MDSKNVFIAASHMKGKLVWENSNENEWSYIGEGSTFQSEKAQELVNRFFSEKELYIVVDRHDSHAIEKKLAISEIQKKPNNIDVIICNKQFTHMMEFNRIGVYRQGKVSD